MPLALTVEYIDWLALALGTIGTVIWAHNGSWSRYAAVLWLASSILWLIYAWLNGLPALGGRDAISIALYVYGGYRWLKNTDPPIKPSA